MMAFLCSEPVCKPHQFRHDARIRHALAGLSLRIVTRVQVAGEQCRARYTEKLSTLTTSDNQEADHAATWEKPRAREYLVSRTPSRSQFYGAHSGHILDLISVLRGGAEKALKPRSRNRFPKTETLVALDGQLTQRVGCTPLSGATMRTVQGAEIEQPSGAAAGPAWKAKAHTVPGTGRSVAADEGGKTPGVVLLDLHPENDGSKRGPNWAPTSKNSEQRERARLQPEVVTAGRALARNAASPGVTPGETGQLLEGA